MRLPGFCTNCHRVKQIRVTTQTTIFATTGRMPVGLCAQCEEETEAER